MHVILIIPAVRAANSTRAQQTRRRQRRHPVLALVECIHVVADIKARKSRDQSPQALIDRFSYGIPEFVDYGVYVPPAAHNDPLSGGDDLFDDLSNPFVNVEPARDEVEPIVLPASDGEYYP